MTCVRPAHWFGLALADPMVAVDIVDSGQRSIFVGPLVGHVALSAVRHRNFLYSAGDDRGIAQGVVAA